MLKYSSLILHSCYTEYEGQALLFSAPSGTGKTTQANLWKEQYHSRIVNGDKALLVKDGDKWRVYGYPVHGSAPECENTDMPIRALVIVRQSERDWIEEIDDKQKVELVFSECTVNMWNPECILSSMRLLHDFVKSVPVFIQHCTMKADAAQTLHQYLYGEK